MTRPSVLSSLVLVVAVLSLAPFGLAQGHVFLAIEILTLIAMAQSWNFLAGYAGMLSLGHHAFIGVGGYALFFLARDTDFNPYLLVPVAGLVAGVLALILTPVLFRLRDVYLAIGMWVVAEIVRILVTKTTALGGTAGLPLAAVRNLDREWLLPTIYWLSLALAVLLIGLFVYLLRSPFGLGLVAMRDDDVAARSLGVNVRATQLTAFFISAVGCGMAGALIFMSYLFITPESAFDIKWIVSLIFIVIVGGIGTLEGPIIGVLVFFLMRETLAFTSGWYLVALGALTIAVMLFSPDGIAGLFRRRVWPRFFPGSANSEPGTPNSGQSKTGSSGIKELKSPS